MKKLLSSAGDSAVQAQANKTNKTLPSIGFLLLSISSVQVGAALAKGLFASFGPMGTVSLRVCSAAIILCILWRTRLRGTAGGWHVYRWVILFGAVLAAMNLSFYTALSQVPLGAVVTLEFLGPLLVAVIQSRKVIDIVWVLLATCGILLLAPIHLFGGSVLAPLGVGLALLAGVFWGAYILVGARISAIFPGGVGLTLATCVAAILLLPIGILQARGALLNPLLLLAGAGVGLLSTAIPYSLEIEALRHLPTRVFSILLSLEPAVAALVGLIFLHEQLTWRMLLAVVLVSMASIGVLAFQTKK